MPSLNIIYVEGRFKPGEDWEHNSASKRIYSYCFEQGANLGSILQHHTHFTEIIKTQRLLVANQFLHPTTAEYVPVANESFLVFVDSIDDIPGPKPVT
ncbi:hypothetical protein KJ611_00160 [Patescibacteria group bacterium]|nr:hypothetical protein [Patescibacteria group bacterium]MBU1705654.1 hypothetical protein [Patescibacteria group bacterium]